MFVYIHFNVPPTRITDLVRNVSDEKINWYGTVTFVYVYGTVTFVYIYHFCIIIKDIFISFSRVIVVQDFETVTFYVLFVYKSTFSVIFCWMKRLGVSNKFNSLFKLHIFTARSFILLVRGYIEVKINNYEIWKAWTQLILRCLKYIKEIFSPHAVLHSCFLIPPKSFYGERAKSLEKFFSKSEKAIWSILLKYQEIYVHIQTFTNESWNVLLSYFFERY